MKKVYVLFIGLILLLVSSINLNYISFFVNADTVSETQQTVQKIYYNNNHYVNLSNTTKFSVLPNQNVLYVQNGLLFLYDIESKQSASVNELQNINDLKLVGNFIFLKINTQLVVLNLNYQTLQFTNLGVPANFTADMFSVRQINDTYTLATLNGNVLTIVTFNSELQVAQNSSTVLSTITEILSVTLSNEYVFVAHKDGSTNNILQINLNNLQTQNNINNITIYNTTEIEYANLYDKNLILTISNNNLNVLEITYTGEIPTAELKTTLSSGGTQNPSFVLGELTEIFDFEIKNNNITVLDTENKTIQTFELVLSNDSLVINPVSTLLASSGYQTGRFYNPTQINAISDSKFLVADNGNNRINIIDSQITNLTTVLQTGSNITLNKAKNVLQDTNNHLVIYNRPFSENEILIVNQDNFSLVSKITQSSINASVVALGSLTNIAITKQNVLYALDITNNTLLKSENYQTFENITLDFALTIQAGSQILTTPNGNLIIYSDNYLYLVNSQGNLLNSLNVGSVIVSLDVDYYNNIYALTNSQIVKYSTANNEITQVQTATYENVTTANLSLISVSKDTGKIILFDSVNQQFIMVTDSTFSSGLQDFSHPTDITEQVALANLATLATVNNTTYVYDYPNYYGNNYMLAQNTKLIVVTQNAFTNYSFVLFNLNGTLHKGYIQTTDITLQTISAPSEQNNYLTIYHKVKVFKYPTLLTENSSQNYTIQELLLNTLITPISNSITSIDGSTFYAVNIDDSHVGYINTADLIISNSTIISELVQPNAKLFNISGSVTVYAQASSSSQIITSLANLYPIYIAEYNQTSEYTQIVFLDQNNNEIVGYIKTEDVWKKEMDQQTIMIIALALSAVLLLGFTSFVYFRIKKQRQL